MKVAPLASGALALVALQVLLSSRYTSRLGSLLELPGAAAHWLIDPGVPAIPNVTGSNGVGLTGSPTSTTSSTGSAPAPAIARLPAAPKPTYTA